MITRCRSIAADLEFVDYDTRVAAYAVIVDGDRILLSWWNGEGHGDARPGRCPVAAWTCRRPPAEGAVARCARRPASTSS